VHIQVARGQSWPSLPEHLRRRICIELLEQPADAAWLSVLEDMHKQEPCEPRLTAVCAKALCDHREFARAFAVIRRSIVDRAERTFSNDPGSLEKGLDQFSLGMAFLLRTKDYVDLQNRRDAFPRPTSDGQVERAFEIARDTCRSRLFDLSGEDQRRLLFALLDLAKSSDDDKYILEVAEMFVQSSVKENLLVYAEFIRRLQADTAYTRVSTRRAQFIAQFKKHVEATIPNERAFLRLFQKENRRRFEQWMDGTETEAARMILKAISLATNIGVESRIQSIQKAARQVLQGLEDPGLKLDLGLRLVHHPDESLRLLATRTIQECISSAGVRPDQVPALTKRFHLDPQQLRALHARGLLDDANLSPSNFANLYATMGLFGEGAERMKRARQAAIVAFCETGEIGSFHTAMTVTDVIAQFEFLQQSNDILNSVPQSKTPRGLVVAVAKGAHELNQFPLLAMRELKQRGYAIVPLVAGSLQYQPTGIPEIDDIANQFNLNMNYARCCGSEGNRGPQQNWLSRIPFVRKLFGRDNWVWDPAHHELSYLGINAYWGIREDLGCMDRRYSVEFDSPRHTDYLADIRKRIEIWELLLRKISAVGKTRGIPVRLMLQYIHLSTHYYCRKYVEAASAEQDIAVIHSAVGYENYFRNFATDEATTISVQDMTKNAELASGFFAPREWFERHYKPLSNEERDRIVDAVERVTKQNRVRRERNTDAQQLLQFFKSERERGRRVVALFGKVMVDQEMPRGDGVVHGDMRDWFDHSIDIARRNPEILLVIKPHPHEVRDEIALYASEVLKDWLPNPVPQNVHFLGNDQLNLFELAQTTDLALMWHGTSALELGVLGIPTILSAYYGEINCPVGHAVPKSRKDYERLILGYSKSALSIEIRRRSAALIDYLRHKDISTPYRYTNRGFTNRYIQLRWFADDLKAYESCGDDNVTALADRIAGVQGKRG
jgi:hypothetical protein